MVPEEVSQDLWKLLFYMVYFSHTKQPTPFQPPSDSPQLFAQSSQVASQQRLRSGQAFSDAVSFHLGQVMCPSPREK